MFATQGVEEHLPSTRPKPDSTEDELTPLKLELPFIPARTAKDYSILREWCQADAQRSCAVPLTRGLSYVTIDQVPQWRSILSLIHI